VAWIRQNAVSGAPKIGEVVLVMKHKDVEQDNQLQLRGIPGHAEESRATRVEWGKTATKLSDAEKRRVRRALEVSATFKLTVKIGPLVELTRNLEAKVVEPTGSSSGYVAAKKAHFPGCSEWVITDFRRCSSGPIGDGLPTLRAKRIDRACSDPRRRLWPSSIRPCLANLEAGTFSLACYNSPCGLHSRRRSLQHLGEQ
jgi:hypothetical protein